MTLLSINSCSMAHLFTKLVDMDLKCVFLSKKLMVCEFWLLYNKLTVSGVKLGLGTSPSQSGRLCLGDLHIMSPSGSQPQLKSHTATGSLHVTPPVPPFMLFFPTLNQAKEAPPALLRACKALMFSEAAMKLIKMLMIKETAHVETVARHLWVNDS